MNELCSNLDDYLLGDLSPAGAGAFAQHLDGCEECREAIDEQRWIDDVLQASSQLETEVPPPHIAAELRAATILRESFRKRAITLAFASAAALLITVTWLLYHPTGNTRKHVATTTDIPTTPEPPHAMFVAGGDAIAVPIKSRHPDVTIVRVYSKFQPLDNSKMAAFEPESTNLNNLNNFSNGG